MTIERTGRLSTDEPTRSCKASHYVELERPGRNPRPRTTPSFKIALHLKICPALSRLQRFVRTTSGWYDSTSTDAPLCLNTLKLGLTHRPAIPPENAHIGTSKLQHVRPASAFANSPTSSARTLNPLCSRRWRVFG